MTTFSEKDFKDIIYSFFSEYGDDVLKIVKNCIEGERIEFGASRYEEGGGLNAYSMLTGNVYLLSILERFTVFNMSTIVHELGHTIESRKFIIPHAKRGFDGNTFLFF